MKKKLVLVLPVHFKLYEGIVNNLRNSNYEISLLFLTDQPYKYKSFREKLYALIQKNIFNRKDIKYQLAKIKNGKDIEIEFEKQQEIFDYVFIIRPDLFTRETLLKLKSKTKKIVAYQWDGLNRFSDVFYLISIFDRFGVFDIDDYSKYKNIHKNIVLVPNFYLEDKEFSNSNPEEKVFFIGSFLAERIEDIVKIAKYLKSIDIVTDIRIYSNSRSTQNKYNSDIDFFTEKVNYLDVLKLVKNSTVLLDFENRIHNGLSFRIFEGIYYKKKILTNNPLVKSYDFYHPNNIFVLENNNFAEIKTFLSLEYVDIDESVIEKYSFSNWLDTILDNVSQRNT
ncbi:hypothetical protein [Kaistella jeonii]|uniref:Lipopolysaccharide biosynthesis protein n=1 Tax=Kaistella jeonii TaxID=266749 RepID=A0A0C1F942_9FLAO|nr:hypothetical protein [Kaistella jeonii]KIA89647.1 hypothetical protein OA86_03190 [Kaistella jeonii]SFB89227.1 hypothetical protein SAMN05421876_103260 [Kaistella jeonii]VEI95865.1 Uncharacterized protein conserved in bacteria [Kaistella jeonii]